MRQAVVNLIRGAVVKRGVAAAGPVAPEAVDRTAVFRVRVEEMTGKRCD